jgi:hypothetical protein
MDDGWIYALADPRTGLVRYVGLTRVPPGVRYRRHVLRRAKSDHRVTKKELWIRELAAEGRMPLLRVLEYVPGPALADRERWWRRHYAQLQGESSTDSGWIGDTNPWAYRP